MTYALFCDICKFGSFSNFKIDPFICVECKNDQADRLNPEDHFVGDNKLVCDSQNSEYK